MDHIIAELELQAERTGCSPYATVCRLAAHLLIRLDEAGYDYDNPTRELLSALGLEVK